MLFLAGPSYWEAQGEPASDWRTEARAAASRRDWEQAIAGYQKALEQTPQDANLRVELATVLKSAGRFVEAIGALRDALRISPQDERAELELGDTYRQIYNYDEARRIFETAHREHPRSSAPLVSLGLLGIELQTYDGAIAHLQAALRLAPSDLTARDDLAAAYHAKGDQANALVQLNLIIAKDFRNALAHYLRGSIYADRNENGKALSDTQQVFESQPDNKEGRLLLGKIELRLNQCGDAVEALAPLGNSPNAAQETLYLLERAYDCSGQKDLAQKTLARFEEASKGDRSLKENQTQAEHLVHEANALAMKSQFAPALDLLQQAIEKDPQNGDAYSQLAKIFFSEGEMDKAGDAVDHALAIHPYHPDYLYVKGRVLEREGKRDEALQEFEKTVLINPKESDAYYEMGMLYEKRGDQTSAVAAFTKSVELSPDDPDYRRALTAAEARTTSP
jgi:protein O-GlcNAc transferase